MRPASESCIDPADMHARSHAVSCSGNTITNVLPNSIRIFIDPGATVVNRLARSPPTEENRVQSPARSPDFRKWASCRTMPLVGVSSRGSPVSPTPPLLDIHCHNGVTRLCAHVRASTADRTHQATLPDRGRLVLSTLGRQSKTGRSANIASHEPKLEDSTFSFDEVSMTTFRIHHHTLLTIYLQRSRQEQSNEPKLESILLTVEEFPREEISWLQHQVAVNLDWIPRSGSIFNYKFSREHTNKLTITSQVVGYGISEGKRDRDEARGARPPCLIPDFLLYHSGLVSAIMDSAITRCLCACWNFVHIRGWFSAPYLCATISTLPTLIVGTCAASLKINVSRPEFPPNKVNLSNEVCVPGDGEKGDRVSWCCGRLCEIRSSHASGDRIVEAIRGRRDLGSHLLLSLLPFGIDLQRKRYLRGMVWKNAWRTPSSEQAYEIDTIGSIAHELSLHRYQLNGRMVLGDLQAEVSSNRNEVWLLSDGR
ncbi:hypothetical protein PR048_029191 [Dryococelus australis]|uniref:Uncharacterized protein n=1 Tax=Dryococelus australis TaxID=614101 RepID=A0ABQ9GFB5_9NEOP|nr:hypothetical protein PR048_029191 [Dryococelus australis]